MAFCTKCGQQIIDGQPHICPAAQAQPQAPVQQMGPIVNGTQQPFYGNEPYGASAQGGVSFDTEKMKEKYNSVKEKIAVAGGGNAQEDADTFERGKRIVPDIISANDGEIPVKQYDIAKLRTRIIFAKAEGRLQVTNKRVIFRAVGRSLFGRVNLHQEFKIDELAGVEFRSRPDFNFINLFVGIILSYLCIMLGSLITNNTGEGMMVFGAILCILAIIAWIFVAVIFHKTKAVNHFYLVRLLVLSFSLGLLGNVGAIQSIAMGSMFGSSDEGTFYGIVAALTTILILINLFLYAFVPNLVIKVKTKGSFAGIEVMKEQPIGLFTFLIGKNNAENSGFLEVLPWTDTNQAIKELGTMIDDIQTLGDAAVSKWQQ